MTPNQEKVFKHAAAYAERGERHGRSLQAHATLAMLSACGKYLTRLLISAFRPWRTGRVQTAQPGN